MKKMLKKCVIVGIAGAMCVVGSTGNAYSKKADYNDVNNIGRCSAVSVTKSSCYLLGAYNRSRDYDDIIKKQKDNFKGSLLTDMMNTCVKFYNMGIDDFTNGSSNFTRTSNYDILKQTMTYQCVENTTPEITNKTKKWDKEMTVSFLMDFGPTLYKKGYLGEENALNRYKTIVSKENVTDVEKNKLIKNGVYLYNLGKKDKTDGLPKWKMEMKMGPIKRMIKKSYNK